MFGLHFKRIHFFFVELTLVELLLTRVIGRNVVATPTVRDTLRVVVKRGGILVSLPQSHQRITFRKQVILDKVTLNIDNLFSVCLLAGLGFNTQI